MDVLPVLRSVSRIIMMKLLFNSHYSPKLPGSTDQLFGRSPA
jgi:hypothetical protein